MNGTYFVHRGVCSLGKLTTRDRMPVEDRSLAGPLSDLRRIQPSILVGIAEIHIGICRLVRVEEF